MTGGLLKIISQVLSIIDLRGHNQAYKNRTLCACLRKMLTQIKIVRMPFVAEQKNILLKFIHETQ